MQTKRENRMSTGLSLTTLFQSHDTSTDKTWSAYTALLSWNKAYEAFMGTRKSAATRRAYKMSLDSFYRFHCHFDWRVGAQYLVDLRESELQRRSEHEFDVQLDVMVGRMGRTPWEITAGDVYEWMQSLEHRPMSADGAGVKRLASATIAQMLAGVSSFYEFVSVKYFVRFPDGHTDTLMTRNPVRSVDRPKIVRVRPAFYFTAQQVIDLLSVIPNTIRGKRDFALLVCYLLTGRRNQEIRMLRWRDFTAEEGNVLYWWSGKNEPGKRDVLHPVAWAALLDYLTVSGRIHTIQPDDYVFTAMTDRVKRIRRVSNGQSRAIVPTDWQPFTKPICGREVGRILKLYAAKAGLPAAWPHVLRHTAAHALKAANASLDEISAILNHRDITTTMIYLKEMEAAQLNPAWSAVSANWNIESLMTNRQAQ